MNSSSLQKKIRIANSIQPFFAANASKWTIQESRTCSPLLLSRYYCKWDDPPSRNATRTWMVVSRDGLNKHVHLGQFYESPLRWWVIYSWDHLCFGQLWWVTQQFWMGAIHLFTTSIILANTHKLGSSVRIGTQHFGWLNAFKKCGKLTKLSN